MDRSKTVTLLRSLLDRLDADARCERPLFGGVVSGDEREAMRLALSELDPDAQLTAAASAAPRVKHSYTVKLDDSAFARNTPTDPDYVLCIDFGTAKSKAFASSIDEVEPELLELALGKREGAPDGSVYPVSSSVWVEDDGLMFAGSEAVRRGVLRGQSGDGSRRRLDSLKQELSQVQSAGDVRTKLLEPAINPSGEQLSYDDAITFYLAYLTDLVSTELEAKGKARYMKRRFTLPWWKTEQRSWASRVVSNRLGIAQVLADTFRGRWSTGIPAGEYKLALQLVTEKAPRLDWLLDCALDADETLPRRWGGLLEPLAAGSGRLWSDKATRDLTLVIDVGAGTTDFSLFWTVQNAKGHAAFPVAPGGTAIKMAGDTLDNSLANALMERAHLGPDRGLRERVSAQLYLSGMRRLKEQLFMSGALTTTLADDRTASITLDEFLGTPGVVKFTEAVSQKLSEFTADVHESWYRAAEHRGFVTVVVTGGGCTLPMITQLAQTPVKLGGRPIRLVAAKSLPPEVEERGDVAFNQEYPQLAVAIGGAMPQKLDERVTQTAYLGEALPPGILTRFPTQGL
jgi:molecular chaperone HscA